MTDIKLRASQIGEFIRYGGCERRFKLGLQNSKLAKELPFVSEIFHPIDPILQEIGKRREDEWQNSLLAREDWQQFGAGSDTTTFEALLDFVLHANHSKNIFAREVSVSGVVGNFIVEGRIDFVLVIFEQEKIRFRIVECKASRKDRTYHRAQVSLYKLLFCGLLSELQMRSALKITHYDVECAVVRIDDKSNEGQSLLEVPPLETTILEQDLSKLLAEGGLLDETSKKDISEIPYHLNQKCDDCIFAIHCFPESGRQESLELIGIDPTTSRILRSVGIESLEALAQIDPEGTVSQSILCNPSFTHNLELLKAKAQARLSTLPRKNCAPSSLYEVLRLPYKYESQLPEHAIGGQNLVRIYLCVDLDYTEDRIIAISAHVTSSNLHLVTPFIQKVRGKKEPAPNVLEYPPERDGQTQGIPLSGLDVIFFKKTRWSGSVEKDSVAEKELLETFFEKLLDAIENQSSSKGSAPVHLYVWNRNELRWLIQACSRSSSKALSHLQELLGCREPTEQLIYSCLQNEIDDKYGLGYTSNGLVVVSSLRWFGQSYHWMRRVNGQIVDLYQLFRLGIFDFQKELFLDHRGRWAMYDDEACFGAKFEVKSRFNDGLPAPYWHSVWKNLPSGQQQNKIVAKIIDTYAKVDNTDLLNCYLQARVHALRWIEEKIIPKNKAILKPSLNINEIRNFRLDINSTAKAALDFLRIDQHVKATDWIADHLTAPKYRVFGGRMIPLKQVSLGPNNEVIAKIDPSPFGLTLSALRSRVTIGEGDFIRLTPRKQNPSVPQSIPQLVRSGSTGLISSIDWEKGDISLSIIPNYKPDLYRVMSISWKPGMKFDFACLDESCSDFVGARVDHCLEANRNSNILNWFDRISPNIPPITEPEPHVVNQLAKAVDRCCQSAGLSMADDQVKALYEGIKTRIQLLQGPPGTGKTTTTAVAIFARLLFANKKCLVLAAAGTHMAVNALLEKMASLIPFFQDDLGKTNIVKMEASGPATQNAYEVFQPSQLRTLLKRDGHLIVGGTTATLLKACAQLDYDLHPDLLIVDEAGMMLFAHFLGLASLLHADSTIMLAGDHRQLAPIVAHDWEKEDRPPTVLYQPYLSAYLTLEQLAAHVSRSQIARTALSYTFRLPQDIRELISPLYEKDSVYLEGPNDKTRMMAPELSQGFREVWKAESELVLIMHNEKRSRQHNELEVELIESLIIASNCQPNTIAVVTPHRAQRTLLQSRLKEREEIRVIDTVERLQGGECPIVIYSGCVSDPNAIASLSEFILDINRTNVAFSRAKQKLIVVCSEMLLDFIPTQLEIYEHALLWKVLRAKCNHLASEFQMSSQTVKILLPKPKEAR